MLMVVRLFVCFGKEGVRMLSAEICADLPSSFTILCEGPEGLDL